MFLLKKLFQLRDHTDTDGEKPFMEHLNDLRSTLIRIIMTLVISMIVCFTLQGRLMRILLAPYENVGRQQEYALLPEKSKVARPLDVETWEKAKALDQGFASLAPEARADAWRACADPALVFHARSVGYLRAALALPEDKREAYVKTIRGSAPGGADGADYSDAEMQKQIVALLESKESPAATFKGTMSTLKPTESFMLSMKLSFFAGIVVSFPLLLYFVLQFVVPGLHQHERKVLWPALVIGFGLFILGVLFAYYLVLPKTLVFFAGWGVDMGVSNDWRIGEYISFASQFTLLFGAAFELPVVVMVAVKLGLLTYETMRKSRRYAILAIVIIAVVITPSPDVSTQALMAAPMIIFYEICIWLTWWDERKRAKAEEAEARERMERLLLKKSAGSSEDATVVTVHPVHHDDRTHDLVVDPEIAGDHPEPPVEHDPDLLPPPPTREEPRQE